MTSASTGAKTKRLIYDGAWGKLIAHWVDRDYWMPYQFAGRYGCRVEWPKDNQGWITLIQMGARYYDYWYGRFTSREPLDTSGKYLPIFRPSRAAFVGRGVRGYGFCGICGIYIVGPNMAAVVVSGGHGRWGV